MKNNQTKIAAAVILVVVIIAAALALSYAPSTVTTANQTTTVAQVQNSSMMQYPRVLNQTKLQSIFGINGTYNSSTYTTLAPINNKSTVLNITSAEFDFNSFGPTNMTETISYPTANYLGYSPVSGYYYSVNSFVNYSQTNSAPITNQTATVDGMTYTIFTQQTRSEGIYNYLVGYKGIVSVSLTISSTLTSPVSSTTTNALVTAIAQAI